MNSEIKTKNTIVSIIGSELIFVARHKPKVMPRSIALVRVGFL